MGWLLRCYLIWCFAEDLFPKCFSKCSNFLKEWVIFLNTTDSGLMILLIKLYLAGGGTSYNSLTIEILLYFNIILMSYRFECGLCSSVASAQLQFYPKKTQDRLIGLPVIVRLKWSEQGLMFLNQMRGLRQKKKKGEHFYLPPPPKYSVHPFNHLFAILKFATI